MSKRNSATIVGHIRHFIQRAARSIIRQCWQQFYQRCSGQILPYRSTRSLACSLCTLSPIPLAMPDTFVTIST
uniref:Transposase n=1 Tax=Macrostomum lignano TaxID=282301 RepID=A0A1I8F217_9PLAT